MHAVQARSRLCYFLAWCLPRVFGMQTYCVPLNSKQINAFFGYEQFWNYSYIWCPLGYMIAFEFFFHLLRLGFFGFVNCFPLGSANWNSGALWYIGTLPSPTNVTSRARECERMFLFLPQSYVGLLVLFLDHNLSVFNRQLGVCANKMWN